VNRAYTDIISPTDGVVISRSVDVGQTVAASFQSPILFVIAQDLRKMQVDTSVAEADVGRLQSGMDATFTVDAFPGERFKGQVRQIRNAPQTVQNVVTYDAVIDVANAELKLRPGMTANVTFVASEKEDVLRVPNAAVRFRPPPEMFAALGLPPPGRKSEGMAGGAGAGAGAAHGGQGSAGPANGPGMHGMHGGGAEHGGGSGAGAGRRGPEGVDRRTLWILKGGQPQGVPVRVGLSDGSLTEIAEGNVSEGDAVVTDVTINAKASGSGTGSGSGPPAGAGAFRRVGL
jgi:HlyD family secretion protein